MTSQPPSGPTYTWNTASGRYRSQQTGRYVSFRDVRDLAVERAVSAAENRMAEITQQRIDGTIDTRQWREQMRQEIKTLHVAAAEAASGGRAQMSQADWGAVGARVRAQNRWLDRFAQQIDSGAQPLDGRAIRRARMYAQAGRATWEETRRRVRREEGWQEEQRVLGPAEHCHTVGDLKGCVELAGRWKPVGQLPGIGATPCHTACHCHFTYRKRNRRGAWEYSRE